MKSSLTTKLASLVDRHEEVAALLGDPETAGDTNRFRELSREYAQLDEVVVAFNAYRSANADVEAAQEMLSDADPELREMAAEELAVSNELVAKIESDLQVLLLPKDKRDSNNVYLEIRAGTGGDEAAIFSGDLFRMYSRYAESRGWRLETISDRAGDHGGFKEIISRVVGEDVYAYLKFESGAHRVQRVPETESQGRIHTSACTVAVMAEPDDVEAIDIRKEDLRIDTFRSSGAGGQHVNTTDSAVRITHLPTRAMSLLSARLLTAAEDKAHSEQAAERRNLVGSGDRSERIRTYNFPQGRVTDHRINLTLYKLDEIVQGDLDALVQPLRTEHQADLLAALGSTE